MNITQLVDVASKSDSSTRESVLDSDTISTLDEFVTWLMSVENKTENTARSYRSYVVSALISDKEWSELSSDIRSGCRAFARFQNT